MDVLKALEEKAFWGHEFLTWLWFRIETAGGPIPVEGVGPVTLWIEDLLVLGSPDTRSKRNILREGEVADSAEAAAALAVGKKVLDVRLGMAVEDREYAFGLRGDTLELHGLRLPPTEPDGGEGWHGTVAIRVRLVQEVLDAVDGLFREFVALRISDRWPSVLASLSEWIAGKRGG